MVLCPNHHDQASKGAMREAEQRELKARPCNIVSGRTKGILEVKQDYCAAEIGDILIVGEGPFVRIEDEDVISLFLAEQSLEVSLRLFSQQDELLLEIVRNEWTAGDPLPWDIEAGWQRLTLRERERHISIAIDARHVPLQLRAELWRAGHRVTLGPNGIILDAAGIGAGGFVGVGLVGSTIEVSTTGWRPVPQPNIGVQAFVNYPDKRLRLLKAKEAWQRLKRDSASQREHNT